MPFVLATDPGVEPPVENEQEKIDELKQVITRIQERNCKPFSVSIQCSQSDLRG
jgi:hypothetical protein